MTTSKKHRIPSRFLNQTAYSVRVDGTHVVTACKRCGREESVDVKSTLFARRMLTYWSREQGGCAAFCKVCDKSRSNR